MVSGDHVMLPKVCFTSQIALGQIAPCSMKQSICRQCKTSTQPLVQSKYGQFRSVSLHGSRWGLYIQILYVFIYIRGRQGGTDNNIIMVGNPDLYIGSFYRHTKSDPSSLKTLHDNIEKLTTGKKFPNLIVAGDFNLPDINWPQHSIAPNPSSLKTLHDNIEKLTKRKKFPNLIVAGDFNLPDINCLNIASPPTHSMEKNWMNLD